MFMAVVRDRRSVITAGTPSDVRSRLKRSRTGATFVSTLHRRTTKKTRTSYKRLVICVTRRGHAIPQQPHVRRRPHAAHADDDRSSSHLELQSRPQALYRQYPAQHHAHRGNFYFILIFKPNL